MPKSPRLNDTAALVSAGPSSPDYVSVRKMDGGYVVSQSSEGGEYRESICTEKPRITVDLGKGSKPAGSSMARAIAHAKR